jgi:hypothetical protein
LNASQLPENSACSKAKLCMTHDRTEIRKTRRNMSGFSLTVS